MKPYTFIAKASILLKSGTIIHKGSKIEVVWDSETSVTSASVKVDGKQMEKRFSNRAIVALLGKKIPSEPTLSRWNKDGYCKTILGNKTEPDGRDEHGSPSWLLAMGLI